MAFVGPAEDSNVFESGIEIENSYCIIVDAYEILKQLINQVEINKLKKAPVHQDKTLTKAV
jgi:hypothetical protein